MSKRDAILVATLKLLAGKGFHGFSIKQVADLAGVATGTVYLYFRDREHLIEELHEATITRVIAELSDGHDFSLAPFEQYQRICLRIWQLFMREPDMLLSKLQFDHLPCEVIRQSEGQSLKADSPLWLLFDECKAQGILKPLPNEVLFALGLEPCFALALKHTLGIFPVDASTLEAVIQATWDGICLRSSR
ncbi:TetR/AcrR family transcriptional regulator [Cellvibrio polysaccharolyticus]|uniref:TetR/AcrR family transcriptional regulator n=1 Tax=Cellvibrio polysaccharolyticus TaxID=2082724 RepID=A0A928YVP5_9GAMM|nr:TetR/AcrR family transcriptional regulator [Cellvibrio polysaccharolyticus]MBE8717298.1 TetR/AcrR family transcriptional regulator [Cellvibrio polysaccharolyticus]